MRAYPSKARPVDEDSDEDEDRGPTHKPALFCVFDERKCVSSGIPTLEDARTEAQRQARKNPGFAFYITGPLEEVIAKEIPVEIKPYVTA